MIDMEDYYKTAQMFVYLLSCAVNEKKSELKADEIDFDGLYSLAHKHVLCAAVAFALESAGIIEPRFEQAKLKAKRKLGLFDIERKMIYQKLNEAGIWFAPLKGIVIKDFYPRYGMREMSDNDIFCDSTKMAEVREIMESLGYFCDNYGKWNHDTYQKPPTIEFEMHHSLFEKNLVSELDSYYANVFERLVHIGGSEYAFCDENFYIYLLAHGYKHFSHNGTGIRLLLDIYVYLQTHFHLDFDYIRQELEKLRLTSFEQSVRELAVKLFDLQKLTEQDKELFLHFLDSPLYGSVSQGEYNMLTRNLAGKDTGRVKAKYLFDRIFLHGDALEKSFPFFAKHKGLLPCLYVYRLFKGLFTHPKGIAHETKNVVKYRSAKNKRKG